ncbi:hypothetical protein N7492_004336 [Penicillium capsulatum]|uniref:Diphthamide biosynthesis protein 4 n=1 Tax=Penicillium capsulatum TaxID=69766 RepID=A0A9W9LR20_9EURO|nr:hypothetical protein N7492_004336 [Penicillium capsulatum]KAJ6136546.1 hypothetical protein N7512_001706 [Penicillium capsulatum]
MARSTPITVDFYQILNLPFTGSTTNLPQQQIKLAYHKALLRHHPDKAAAAAQEAGLVATPNGTFAGSKDQRTYSIDEITTAYKTLSDPGRRADYDRTLLLDRVKAAEREKTGDVFHTGLEVVDLEDLSCDEGSGGDQDSVSWYRGCRCGDEKGFLLTEDDLDREAEHGEIVIGCRGCSLWLKILFAVEDDG